MKALAALAVASVFAAQPAVAEPQAPPLPSGRLQGISMGNGGGWFLVLDQSKKAGETADVWTLLVLDPPSSIDGRDVVYSLTHLNIACQARTTTELGTYAYDEGGGVVVILPQNPAAPIKPRSAFEFMARVVCDGEQPPTPNFVAGPAQALQAIRTINRR
ncbi:surface-adhesin E family protein [Caulobacter sp. 17J65-9]|uniref:surface-adhesin E family protein n=1 Tax=Caulobacter sp. 17J65-9 TaxID=2709382 RepID=UPI0013CA79E9|nr:surface-adhesin E family protein [Caulobacter sp. 17J65-9]NEX93379.1 hypothetical protein [Caulobacter sp. 17J65-9]